MATTAAADGNRVSHSNPLDLSWLPPVYVLASNLLQEELHQAEEALSARGAPLTYDILEAKLVFGNVSKAQRARLELRWKGVYVEEVQRRAKEDFQVGMDSSESEPAKKKRKLAEDEQSMPLSSVTGKGSEPSSGPSLPELGSDEIIVVKLSWLTTVISNDKPLPLGPDIVLYARKSTPEELHEPSGVETSPSVASGIKHIQDPNSTSKGTHQANSAAILERARADPQPKPAHSRFARRDRIAEAARHDIIGKTFSSSQVSRPIQLAHQVSSEELDSLVDVHPKPDWVLQNKIYSCERSTPIDPPNSEFIDLLKAIRLARELTLDHIGVRAYSTSIASLAAYPYPLHHSREVTSLPGCDHKIAHLHNEYKTTGQLKAVLDINADPALTCLRSFHAIWGVGAVTARDFYYDRGWRDLDDIIEYGWKTLTRVQQIGLKYYDEFNEPLTRPQVEEIAKTITHHAALATNDEIQTAIVGGYRRGKVVSHDVDVIISHPDESQTLGLIERVVESLEREGWITHTLTMHLTTSNRGQTTLPINTRTAAGHSGFDSLDKALVVWQSPHCPPQQSTDLASNSNPNGKTPNPNPHRRVDIIIAPWRTVGCAVAGWTSGTTFQRDLRRYCKYKKGWKFDSSGVRERGTGAWVDLEGWRDVEGRCRTWEEAEKRVFEGLGLVWREPEERNTG